MRRLILLLWAFAGLFSATDYCRANNLVVGGGSRLAAPSTDKITFTLSWDNSWMVGGTPGNHDAVWVFVKFRECGTSGPWTHALLDTTMANHTFSSSLTYARKVSLNNRQGVLPVGATLSNGKGNNTGIVIRRSTLGTGSIVSAACTLRIVNPTAAFDPAKTYDIRVFGIEMVQVTQSGFTIGDGTSTSSFTVQAVGSEAPIAAAALYAASPAIPDSFPKGYSEFYCMKYEISQGQYGQFLNTVDGVSGSPSLFSGQNRNMLQGGGPSPNDMYSPNEDRAQNYMNWDDLLAYLDWAALRPMSELEYEKACRGSLGAVGGGYAWGNSTIIFPWYLNSATEDGTEYVHTLYANCNFHFSVFYIYNYGTQYYPPNSVYEGNFQGCSLNYGWGWDQTTAATYMVDYPFLDVYNSHCIHQFGQPLFSYVGGTRTYLGYGPLGVGIFARDTTLTRARTGATYYGAMEMSGNVWEQAVAAATGSTTYSGRWGDGYLSVTGKADAVGWPGGGAAFTNRALRGGGYDAPPANCRTSDRQFATSSDNSRDGTSLPWYNSNSSTYRNGGFGGRGVR